MARVEVGLPVRPFLFTLDQIADLLAIEMRTLRSRYIYFHGVSSGGRPKDRLQAINIAPQGENAEWRVSEQELKRWLRYMGFNIYDRASVRV